MDTVQSFRRPEDEYPLETRFIVSTRRLESSRRKGTEDMEVPQMRKSGNGERHRAGQVIVRAQQRLEQRQSVELVGKAAVQLVV